jgi:hypothetical protein
MAEKRKAIGEEFSATESKVAKIREILIGTQMQTMGQRIEAIETQLEQQVVSRREDKARLTALESVLEKQIPELSDRCQQTCEANEHLRQSIESAIANIHDKIANQISSLEDRFFEQRTEFRAQLDLQVTALRSNMQALRTEFMALLVSELRQDMIRRAAYRRAEQRGFAEGDPAQDWQEAEAEVERELEKKLERIKIKIQSRGS